MNGGRGTLGARLAAMAGALSLVVAPLPAMSQAVGVNAAVRNQVRVRQTATAAERQAVVREQVSLGNAIATGGSSSLQIMLLDRSTLTLGQNARLTVDRFVYDPARRSSSVGTSVAKGTFRFLSGKAARGGNNTVSTPAATIGIRGTILEGSVGDEAILIARQQPGLDLSRADPATATLIVLRGPGAGAPASETRGIVDVTAGGQTVTLDRPSMAIFVAAAGERPQVFDLSDTAYLEFDRALRTAPVGFEGLASAYVAGNTVGGGEGGTASGRGMATWAYGLAAGITALFTALVIADDGEDLPASP